MEGCRGKQYSQHLQAIDELNNQQIGWQSFILICCFWDLVVDQLMMVCKFVAINHIYLSDGGMRVKANAVQGLKQVTAAYACHSSATYK